MFGFEESRIPRILVLAQAVEVVALFILPLLTRRFGLKLTIALGICCWLLRYTIFAVGGPLWLVVIGQGLHGVAYVFFFVSGQIYINNMARSDTRASAQSIMVLATWGLGKLLSGLIAGPLVDYFTTDVEGVTHTNWHCVFLAPAGIMALAIAVLLVAFQSRKPQAASRTFSG
jgi:MFS family permease